MELFTFDFLICLLSGLACFWLFFKCVDWFEKFKEGEFSSCTQHY